MRTVSACFLLISLATAGMGVAADQPMKCSVTFEVNSTLTMPNTPMDPTIDFAELIRQTDVSGRLDPNSIRVIDVSDGTMVPHATTEDFAYADRGRLEWVIAQPDHVRYEIRFCVVEQRPALLPAKYTPQIGTGDLLRYNAGAARPISLCYPSRLVDINSDGKPDLVGCWNYAYRPGSPWDGIVCYPRVGDTSRFEFGDLTRIRFVSDQTANDFQHFEKTYMHCDFADLNRDGKVDIVYSPSGGSDLHLYLNTGRLDAGNMPIFAASGSVSRQTSRWEPCRVVDLNGDDALDVVIAGHYLRNTNLEGWPLEFAKAVELDAGTNPCFYDIDGDAMLDSVCLVADADNEPHGKYVAWRKNDGSHPPHFAAAERVADIGDTGCTYVCAVTEGRQQGLLVQHDMYQRVSFYEQVKSAETVARFRHMGTAGSVSAVMSLSDQAWPCLCDWEADGDLDLLVGGGYGWPRIVINSGTNAVPRFEEARHILSSGKPIKILRDEVLGGQHWHNMGYLYPVYTDWDADGLPDLVFPNETNRIFWYRNVGTRKTPDFGERRQVLCDGYPDSAADRTASAKLAADKNVPNSPYPLEKSRPFFWRTGAALADFNGDGLTDLVTHDGYTRQATLFVQYRDRLGSLRLKKDKPLALSDGRPIDDRIVSRQSHWTESFRSTDWNSDGLTDIIYSCAGAHGGIQDSGSIYLLENTGSKTDPVFAPPKTLRCFGKPIRVTNHGPNAWAGDFDGDGRPDILACVEWSVYPFFSHTAVEMAERPKFSLGKVRLHPTTTRP